ncbi:tetratricopeptide repeat-containing sensor histidine kinase [Jiulongibacter sediminis]|uniref:tetratricopeptide repeat-containing sensor histidine kinase n=1 Tax=Jiulongibacter sediminis TaxID=1605367 RepID=UPI0006DCE627|nr:histidine kinase dimerization/phosphoacceptor domain -containing protein [Jiulongibacter sediminis]
MKTSILTRKSSPLLFVLLSLLFATLTKAQKSERFSEEVKQSVLAQRPDSILAWLNKHYDHEIGIYPDVAKAGIERATKTNNKELIGDFYSAFAEWYGYHGLYSRDSVIKHSLLALKNYELSGNKQKTAQTHRSVAYDYINERQIPEAQSHIFKAIELFEKVEDQEGIASSYRMLANSYIVTKDAEKALKYLDLAAPIFRDTESYPSLSYTYLGYINAYILGGQHKKALEAADECLRIVKEKVPNEVFVEVRAWNFKGDAYLGLNKNEEALKAYQKAYDLCVIQIGEERSATWLTQVGWAYQKLGKYQLAIDNLLAGIKAYEEKDNENIVADYQKIAECYEALGDYKNALIYTHKADAAQQRLYASKIESLENEAVIKYETGKKDEALAAQSELLAQKNRTETITFTALGILVLLLAGLYYSFRKNQKAKNEIAAKNAENELLLKEIHHRVKNNLEMVKSLIALQSARLEDSVTKDAMIASQNRVQSMGIIHQKLYQGKNLGSIEMKDYFINLSEEILDSFNADEKVKIECAMDTLELDVDTAVPIGLIVNELLTNALKYAFPDRKEGEIMISLSKDGGKILKLNVTDNGVGKQKDVKPKGTGFGSQLIQLLTQQLNGTMKEESHKGTVVSFEFKLDQAA